jgi:hypothetical protein
LSNEQLDEFRQRQACVTMAIVNQFLKINLNSLYQSHNKTASFFDKNTG